MHHPESPNPKAANIYITNDVLLYSAYRIMIFIKIKYDNKTHLKTDFPENKYSIYSEKSIFS